MSPSLSFIKIINRESKEDHLLDLVGQLLVSLALGPLHQGQLPGV